MSGAGVRLVAKRLARGFHLGGHYGKVGVDPLVSLAVDPQHGSPDPAEIRCIGCRAVRDDHRLEPRIVGRVSEALPAAPAEADGADLVASYSRQAVHIG